MAKKRGKRLDALGVSAFCESMALMTQSGIQPDEAVELLRQLGVRRVGVGWGYLVGQLVSWLEENPQPNSTITDICPLVGNASIPARNYQSNENVRLMAQQLGAVPHFLYLPSAV